MAIAETEMGVMATGRAEGQGWATLWREAPCNSASETEPKTASRPASGWAAQAIPVPDCSRVDQCGTCPGRPLELTSLSPAPGQLHGQRVVTECALPASHSASSWVAARPSRAAEEGASEGWRGVWGPLCSAVKRHPSPAPSFIISNATLE